MTLSARRPEDVINLALARIGSPLRVNNIYEGTRSADLALDIYGSTRDELLRQNDWGFAERNLQPTLLKQAPASYVPGVTPWDGTLYPPVPYIFEYAYPDDCLKVRALKAVPILIPNFDPQPNVWSVANDNFYIPPRKVILCYVQQAMLVYTGQVTDPLSWESDFIEALAAALGRRMAPLLSPGSAVQFAAQDEAVAAKVAEMEQG